MKKILSCTLAFGLCLSVFSQKKAITDTGDEVLLYTDGTWKYANEPSPKGIPVNPKTFTKGSSSTFLIKSNIYNVGMWIDPKIWSFSKDALNEVAEYEFQLKDEDKELYGMMINESDEVPLEKLRKNVLTNANEVATAVRILKEEYRTVNGQKVLMLQFRSTIDEIDFAYYGYYFSNKNGTTQIMMYTYEDQLKKFTPEIEAHLNGFVVLPKN